MKKTVALLLALLLVCLLALPALAEGDDATVTAVGTASVTVTPDRATFTAGVTTQDAQVKTAQALNAAAMTKLLDAFKALGVAAEDLQTQNYTVNPVYEYDSATSSGQQTLTGYMVSNSVVVTVRDLARLPELLDAAVTAGANQTYGIGFESSQTAAAYDQALAAAAQDALRKAKLLAQAAGREAGDVLTLAEANDVYLSYSANKAMAYDVAGGTPIEAGTLTVSANVHVEMQLR